MFKTFKRVWQRVTLRQFISICLAGILMLASTACGGIKADMPQTSNPSVGGQGMYQGKDTNRDTTASDAKAKAAIQEAEQRRQNFLGSDDAATNVKPGKQVSNKAQNLTESAKRAARNTAQNVEEGVNNLKQNTQEAAQKAANAIDQAT